MLATRNGLTIPGWRDFERSVALAIGGKASESKAVFDVMLSRTEISSPRYGLSCKMRSELNRVSRDGRVTIEVSNSAGEFWGHLSKTGIHQRNYREMPEELEPLPVDQEQGILVKAANYYPEKWAAANLDNAQ